MTSQKHMEMSLALVSYASKEKTLEDILLKIARGGECRRPSPAEDGIEI